MPDDSAPRKRLLAVCGKGGVGKTVFTSLAARSLLESHRAGRLLLIDADPAGGLPSTLGVTVTRTMGHVREEIIGRARRAREQDKVELANTIDYLALEALKEMGSFSLLAMGRTETLGCYCPVNTLLRSAIEVLSRSFDTILIDGEAGLEQLNRQVMQGLDILMVVSDLTSRGLRTAAQIRDMVERDAVIRCQRMGLVVNRAQGDREFLRDAQAVTGLQIFGVVPLDENITRYDLTGQPLLQLPDATPALVAVHRIVEQHVLA